MNGNTFQVVKSSENYITYKWYDSPRRLNKYSRINSSVKINMNLAWKKYLYFMVHNYYIPFE